MAQPGNGKHTGRLAVATLAASSALDAMWSEVDRIRGEMIGKTEASRPAGSITVAEYAGRYAVGSNTARNQLERIAQRGSMRKSYVLLPDTRGRVSRAVVYVPAKQAA